MYIESSPGELGFPHHRMGPGGEGGWRHHMQSGGPGAEMQVSPQSAMPGAMPIQHGAHYGHRHHMMHGADGVEIMGFGADAVKPPMMLPPVVMAPVSQHSDTAMYVATGALLLGLGFVIWKATR